MKFLARLFGSCFFLGLLFFATRGMVLASAEFFISYDVVYEANLEEKIKVSQAVSLTNKFSNIYATAYSITLERGDPQNISASDGKGSMVVNTQKEGEKTTITLEFNEQVVGKEKTLKFNLQYEVGELIHRYGQVYEVNLPKIVGPEEIENYAVTLKVPSSFGKPAYLSPSPKNQKTDSSWQWFFFDKEQLSASGGVAAFGHFQVFNFVLTYHLNNPTQEVVLTPIAFPPDTSYQKLSYQKINPRPENIEVDGDGNWLGLYQLKKGQAMTVVAYGQAKIFAQPQEELAKILSPETNLNQYLTAQKYWEKDESQIQSLAQKLKTPRQIHDFVVKTLEYDYSRVREGAKRFGAIKALEQPERAICMEYTDLFIALARAAGIPARELNGFAYTDNPLLQPLSLVQDVLHAWPEYWDEKRKLWVQIDPTWQDTSGGVDYFSKLDLGHFVFAIHGQDSQIPPPAGAYKGAQTATKDVAISFGQYEETLPPTIKIDFLLPRQTLSEKPTAGKIKVTNLGQSAIYNLDLQVEVQDLKLLTNNLVTLGPLPPFASREIPLTLVPSQNFSSGVGKIFVLGNQQRFEYHLAYESLVLRKILPAFGLLLLLIILIWGGRKLILWRRSAKSHEEPSSTNP